MPNVLIRDVPAEDLERIRAAASEQDSSLQGYLRAALHMQAVHLKRQEALTDMSRRLADRPEVPSEERAALLDAIDSAHGERADHLADGPAR